MALIIERRRSIPRNKNDDFKELVLPDKLASYRSYGEKLISLFAKLLFSQESQSLTDLARLLKCSKQTVLRLVDDIRRAYGVEIEESIQERRKYFRLKKETGKAPAIPLTAAEVTTLQMCKAFAEHLLGPELMKYATQAIEKSSAFISDGLPFNSNHFASIRFGYIDYTPHQETIRTLIRAMDDRKICEVTYKAALSDRPKTYFIKPLKLFSHKETLYLSTRMARFPGKAYRRPEFDPLLAIHRIQKLEMTDRLFTFPKNYDFQKDFDGHFGIIKGKPFKVEVEFSNYAANFVAERVWTNNQKFIKSKDGKIRLLFTSFSKPEFISWMLSFGDNAKLIKPKWAIAEVKKIISK
jgi:predicted DNA-binding transcriptional regulator YafY